MGPHAGLLLADRVLAATRATTDQEHLSFVVASYSDRIPDRTTWLEDPRAPDPAPAIIRVGVSLAAADVRFAGIACNTAHVPAIHDRVLAGLAAQAPGLEILHLIRETAHFVHEAAPGARRIGILATTGTYRAGLYSAALSAEGFVPLVPHEDTQRDVVHRAIFDQQFGLKAQGNPVTDEVVMLLELAIAELRDQGADAVVMGCTELSLVYVAGRLPGLKIVDSTTALARALVRRAAPDRLLPVQIPA